MLLSKAIYILGLLIATAAAQNRTNSTEYEAKVVARRVWRYQRVMHEARDFLDQLKLSNSSQFAQECPAHKSYALRLYENVFSSSKLAEDAIAAAKTYNTSKSAGKVAKRAWINSKLLQIFLQSPYCKHGQPWGYEGIEGPQRWGISFPQCKGKYQTPIDIMPEEGSHFSEEIHGVLNNNGFLPQISYPNSAGKLKHVGDVVKFFPSKLDATYTHNDGQYNMIQWHIHTPSEHRVEGRDYVAEIHFVHQLGKELAVIGGFIEIGNVTSSILSNMIKAMAPLNYGQYASFTPNYTETIGALKSSPKFYRYVGSLTTPPCTEGVRWLIASEPIYTVSPDDAKHMMEKWGFNSRETQPLHFAEDVNWTQHRKGQEFYNPPLGVGYNVSTDWEYNGLYGPERWSINYPACAGNRQTPIDIEPESADFKAIGGLVENKGLLPHIFYPNAEGELKHIGDTIKFVVNTTAADQGLLYRTDGIHQLIQWHIHLPSEHRVEGRDFPGEIHFVHKLDNSLAVLGGFVQIADKTDEFLAQALEVGLNMTKGDHVHFHPIYDEVVKKFKESPKYFKYVGSLTTPPCTEGVKWLIAEEPIFTISPEHIKMFLERIGFNARDTLPLKNNADYDWVSQRKGLEIFNPHVDHHKEQHSAEQSHEVFYEGFEGPLFWGLTAPQCNGMYQTPINFESREMEEIHGVLENHGALPRLIYPNTSGELKHLGDVIKFVPNKVTGKYIRPEGAFNLLQWHIHTPSEHRVEGREFVAEVHFVHKLGNHLAVIGAFVELAEFSSEFIAELVSHAVDIPVHGHHPFLPNYDEFVLELKEVPTFYKYIGSLTTPPCTEGVKWLVAEEPLFKISAEDFIALMALTGGNARDTKPLRYLANENWVESRHAPTFFNPPVSSEASHEWDYNGIKGPEYWGISYPLCDANLQTPIDFEPESSDFGKIHGLLHNGGALPLISYPNITGKLKNVGDTWKFSPVDTKAGTYIRKEGQYSLAQWHIHLPSEHRVEGRDFVGEMHFVHLLGDSIAVLGGFVQLAESSSPLIEQMFTIGMGLSYEQYATFSPDYTEIVKRFKESHEFYKYTGSLTTPPCTEGVQWLVSAEPIFNISYQHVLQFQQKFGFNARDTKPLRYEADLDWVAARSAPEFLNPLSGDEVPEHSEYNGFDGSAYWQLSHPACGGNIQTPISFEPHSADSKAIGLVLDNSARKYPGLQYPVEAKAAGTLKNMGETLKWSPSVAGSGTFTRPDGIYNLLQFHFHVPSEHRIDGVEYPMEIHFVHNQGSKLAVVGGFVQLGLSSSPFIFEMLEKGKLLKKGESAPFTPPFAEVVAKLKEAKTFFKYTGSLTTPPCTEGVKWLVAEEPILTVSADHWKEFMELYEFSARDTQPLRYTANYDWISARKSDYFAS